MPNTTDTYKVRIDKDLKAAMLAGDKDRVQVLRGLKSAILYVEVAKGARDNGLPEDEVLSILSKEAKKRQESADMYTQGGDSGRADTELQEKQIIEAYLPKQLSEDEISKIVDEIAAANGGITKETMGATIAAVKQKSGGAADGAMIARLVRERIS
ncbi:MAG TPA: GatB/YqeY domain-containing protein [Candidatus Saccharimonadales bacterium]|jgi:hypothetical protein